MKAPLYNHLLSLSNRTNFHRFHMPGHKGMPLNTAFDSVFAIDYTEVPETGNLYDEGGIIQQAETLAADFFQAERCFFLTCGATQGLKAAIATFCTDKLLIDRNCHKSVQDCIALMGLNPSYIYPQFLPDFGVTGHIFPQDFEQALIDSGASCAIVTSPTYYGFCLDISALSAIAHRNGARLIVDSAHGSHLQSCGCPTPLTQGADAVIFSAHKTLMAMGQGAYLLMSHQTEETYLAARRATSLFGTSSPSYAIMASLDFACGFARESVPLYKSVMEQVAALRKWIAAFTEFSLFPSSDPLRLTVGCSPLGLSGYSAAKLFASFGVEPEMADDCNVVFIITAADNVQSLTALRTAAEKINAGACSRISLPPPPIPSPPHRAISPRQAILSPCCLLSLGDSIGKIAAQCIAPYPPGVAIITPGEIINKNCVEYLLKKGYNVCTQILVLI